MTKPQPFHTFDVDLSLTGKGTILMDGKPMSCAGIRIESKPGKNTAVTLVSLTFYAEQVRFHGSGVLEEILCGLPRLDGLPVLPFSEDRTEEIVCLNVKADCPACGAGLVAEARFCHQCGGMVFLAREP